MREITPEISVNSVGRGCQSTEWTLSVGGAGWIVLASRHKGICKYIHAYTVKMRGLTWHTAEQAELLLSVKKASDIEFIRSSFHDCVLRIGIYQVSLSRRV
jgi:hypothetical protein